MSDLNPKEICPLCSSDIIQQWDTDKDTGKTFFLFKCLNRECEHTWMPTSEEHKLDNAAMLKYRKQVDTLTAEVEHYKAQNLKVMNDGLRKLLEMEDNERKLKSEVERLTMLVKSHGYEKCNALLAQAEAMERALDIAADIIHAKYCVEAWEHHPECVQACDALEQFRAWKAGKDE